MSEDTKVNLIWASTIVLVILTIVSGITYYNSSVELAEFKVKQTALEQGYVQGTIPGQSGVYWIKPDKIQFLK